MFSKITSNFCASPINKLCSHPAKNGPLPFAIPIEIIFLGFLMITQILNNRISKQHFFVCVVHRYAWMRSMLRI